MTVYAAQLEVRGEPQMAASQLVAAGKLITELHQEGWQLHTSAVRVRRMRLRRADRLRTRHLKMFTTQPRQAPVAVAGDVRGALAVLRRAGLLQEAAALGAARLMPGDPDLQVRSQP